MGPIWHLMDNFGAQVPLRLKQPAASSEKKTLKPSVKGDVMVMLVIFPLITCSFHPFFRLEGSHDDFLFISNLYQFLLSFFFLRKGKSDMMACLLKNRWCVLDALLLVVSMFPFLIRCFMKPTSPLKGRLERVLFFGQTKTSDVLRYSEQSSMQHWLHYPGLGFCRNLWDEIWDQWRIIIGVFFWSVFSSFEIHGFEKYWKS